MLSDWLSTVRSHHQFRQGATFGEIRGWRPYKGNMSGALRPDLMTPPSGSTEVADILVAGLHAFRGKKGQWARPGDSSRDCPAAYGGLKPETLKRLKALGDELDGGDPAR